MTIAQKLIDTIHGKMHTKHDLIDIAHTLALTHSADNSIHITQNGYVLKLHFNDDSKAFCIRSGPVWIGEAH